MHASRERGAVKVSVRVEDKRVNLVSTLATREAVEHALRPTSVRVWGQLEDHVRSAAVKISGPVEYDSRAGMFTAGELVEYLVLAGRPCPRWQQRHHE